MKFQRFGVARSWNYISRDLTRTQPQCARLSDFALGRLHPANDSINPWAALTSVFRRLLRQQGSHVRRNVY